MKTGVETENLHVLMNLLAESREEADRFRTKAEQYENILLSTKLLMGHEIKKPITALTGYIDLAFESLDRSGDRRREEAIECLKKARKECAFLDTLNRMFLDLLRIDGEQQDLPVQRIDLEKLIDDIAAGFPENLDAPRRIRSAITPDARYIRFNLDALKTIIRNLIENALLYSNRNDEVSIGVDTIDERQNEDNRKMLRITVKDNGEGVPEEYLQKIFHPFVRLRAERVEGSGLGLTLVRSLVDLYRGEVAVKNRHGSGTIVIITVPMALEQHEQMVL